MKKIIFIACLLTSCSTSTSKPQTPETSAHSGCISEQINIASQRISKNIGACFSDHMYKSMFFMDGGTESFKARKEKIGEKHIIIGNYSGQYNEISTLNMPESSHIDPKTGRTTVIAPAVNEKIVHVNTFDDNIFDLTLSPLPHETNSCKTHYKLVFYKYLLKEQKEKIKDFIVSPKKFKAIASCS